MPVLLVGCSPGPVPVEPAAPEGKAAAACERLVEALPDSVADQPRRSVDPADALAGAWGDPAIVLTCGVPRPEGFGRTSVCTTVNDVDWFVPEDQLEGEQPETVTLTTVHREAYVQVELPGDYWPPATTLVDLAAPVSEAVPATGACG